MNTVKKLSASEKFPSDDVKSCFFVLSFCQLLHLYTFILVPMPSNNWKTKRWPMVVLVVVVKHSISALLRRAQCPARTSEIIVRGQ